MRQKVVWFLIALLAGSVFFVSAHPSEGNIQYTSPEVHKLRGENYAALLLSTPNGLPLNIEETMKTVQEFLLKSSPNAKWHAYAVPELPKDVLLNGYGIKVTKDGRIDVLVLASRRGVVLKPVKVREELAEWGKKAPEFMPDKVPKEKVGVPEGWKVETVDSSGNVRTYTGESSPYWHNFGRLELRLDDPPYGKLYAQFYMWGLWNDNPPAEERFLCTTDENGHGTYRVTPGIAIGGNYGYYLTDDIKIIHDWGVEPGLNGRLGVVKPVGVINNYEYVTVTIGPVSYPLATEGYEVHGDAIDPLAVWDFDIVHNGESSRHSIEFMPSSEGVVKESVLHDGNWHSVIKVKLQAKFEYDMILGFIKSHTSEAALIWRVKVG
ncbi:hypothetical protein A3L12_07085 [Thermococcus sp. P6]|uniref:hypothetical protein n=1 Tax=Thermococcus sp. P6 TaxID=122420 RepID=UPI000B59EA2A|nr:hypothetical protein [Thermococcus sp. P6]ASJ11079.1 hypothetical protein A3L12_07085 [Thermococcus sp. P6]